MSIKFLQVFGVRSTLLWMGAVSQDEFEEVWFSGHDEFLFDIPFTVDFFTDLVHVRMEGYHRAETGWYICDVDDSTVRSYDTYHLHDEQLEIERDFDILFIK